ncbi:MAG TPA: protein translocase subunit SecD [Solirubrobacterales bacterium]|nr:protein translocase subunit SecD [Solirubrobacterales bacterium]
MGSRRRNLFIILLVFALLAASALVIATKPTVLGLDLKGGTQLVYEARPTPQTPDVNADAIERAINIIRTRTDKFGVAEPEISRLGTRGIQVGLPNVQNAEQAIAQVGKTAQLYFYDLEANIIPPHKQGVPRDPASPGTSQPVRPEVYTLRDLWSAVKFAAEQKPRDGGTTTGPTYYLFDAKSHELLAGPAEKKPDLLLPFRNSKRPQGSVIKSVPQGALVAAAPAEPSLTLPQSDISNSRQYVLRDRPALTGTEITNPEQNFDPTTQQPNVTFDFTGDGQSAFQKVTQTIAERGRASAPLGIAPNQAAAFSQHFAIVLDNQVFSSPIIDFNENPQGIDGRQGAQISGNFTISSAQDLATILQTGALPVKLVLISQSTVSATLGQQALDQGIKAGIVGLAVVILFLILYYRVLGVVAVLGLAVYGVFFFALVKLIPITLTLPGIAGLILTIGVAADANIVIFERIKEESRAGRSPLSAIAQGYKRGIATIIDANVITLFTAFILFVLATAGVKGFAFTLGIGTLVSLFTAVLFTQAILSTVGRSSLLHSARALGAGKQRVRWHFDFSAASRWFFSMSGCILAIGAIAMATKQLNLGIDFTSGAKVTASLDKPASVDAVRDALEKAGVDNASSAEIQSIDNPKLGKNVIEIQGKIPVNQVNTTVKNTLEKTFGLHSGEEGFNGTTVGPTFGAQIARSAVIAIIFSLLVIAAYMAIRFEPKYAIPVIIALFHDILITAGVYSLTGQEVTSGTVAAFLTILGYSMYDTVIVFDRIRENVPRMPRAAFSQIANKSMSEVLTRSLITGMSTVFLVTMLLVFGGSTLQDFAFAMIVGVASGAYSSIFIATPVLTHWKEREPAYKARRQRLIDEMGYLPTFPEENVVAKLGDGGEPVPPAPAPARTAPVPVAVEEAEPVEVDGGDGAKAPAEREPMGTAAQGDRPKEQTQQQRAQRRKRQQRRRRKHGRHR